MRGRVDLKLLRLHVSKGPSKFEMMIADVKVMLVMGGALFAFIVWTFLLLWGALRLLRRIITH